VDGYKPVYDAYHAAGKTPEAAKAAHQKVAETVGQSLSGFKNPHTGAEVTYEQYYGNYSWNIGTLPKVKDHLEKLK